MVDGRARGKSRAASRAFVCEAFDYGPRVPLTATGANPREAGSIHQGRVPTLTLGVVRSDDGRPRRTAGREDPPSVTLAISLGWCKFTDEATPCASS